MHPSESFLDDFSVDFSVVCPFDQPHSCTQQLSPSPSDSRPAASAAAEWATGPEIWLLISGSQFPVPGSHLLDSGSVVLVLLAREQEVGGRCEHSGQRTTVIYTLFDANEFWNIRFV